MIQHLDAIDFAMATIPSDIVLATDATIALSAIIRAFAAHTGTLHFLGTDGMLHLAAFHGAIPAPVMEHIRTIEIGKGMAGVCAELNEPVSWCNLNRDGSGVVQSGARSLGLAGSIVVPVEVAPPWWEHLALRTLANEHSPTKRRHC